MEKSKQIYDAPATVISDFMHPTLSIIRQLLVRCWITLCVQIAFAKGTKRYAACMKRGRLSCTRSEKRQEAEYALDSFKL